MVTINKPIHFSNSDYLKSIKSLWIENYEFEWLPSDIFLLENLEDLDITAQPIKYLPDNISDF